MSRRRSRARRRNPRELPSWVIPAGVLVGGGWLLYRVIKGILDINKDTPYAGGGAVGTAANVMNQISGGVLAAGGALFGRSLYDWTHSGETGSMTYYKVTFPGGATHAIGNADIGSDNQITYSGLRYKIAQDASGNKFAVPV